MAKLPAVTVISPTIAAIDAHYVSESRDWDSYGISVSLAGAECMRSLFYEFRWVSHSEPATGERQRLFERGQEDEEKMIRDLRAIGVEIWGEQEKARAIHGFVRGKLDGIALGIIEAPKAVHVVECKSMNTKGYNGVLKHGVKEFKPLHHAQIQLYMHILGHDRGFYYYKCADTQKYNAERVDYDIEFCTRLLTNLERVIFADEAPSRISDDPEHFGCKFCKHHAVCHMNDMPRVSCRTCIHMSAERGGDCFVSCARWCKPLSISEQQAGCPTHLFLPTLVPGRQVDYSESDETITYELNDGSLWTDGGSIERD